MKHLLLLALVGVLPLAAESRPHRFLRISWGALLAGSAADAASSWGRPEANPLLGARFGGRSAAIKFGLTGAVIVAEHFIARKHPEFEKQFAIGNFVAASAFTGVAIRNWRLPR